MSFKYTSKAVLFVFAFILSHFGSAGQETHGGNGFAAEFFLIFDNLLNELPNSCYVIVTKKDLRSGLVQLRQELVVISESFTFHEGRGVGAISYPELSPRMIILSESKWKNSAVEQKTSLVLHEVLHSEGFHDDKYMNSSKILNCWFEAQKDF